METQMGFSYTKNEDYEDFAIRFLGVDYEDFVNLLGGYDDSEFEEIEYEIPAFV